MVERAVTVEGFSLREGRHAGGEHPAVAPPSRARRCASSTPGHSPRRSPATTLECTPGRSRSPRPRSRTATGSAGRRPRACWSRRMRLGSSRLGDHAADPGGARQLPGRAPGPAGLARRWRSFDRATRPRRSPSKGCCSRCWPGRRAPASVRVRRHGAAVGRRGAGLAARSGAGRQPGRARHGRGRAPCDARAEASGRRTAAASARTCAGCGSRGRRAGCRRPTARWRRSRSRRASRTRATSRTCSGARPASRRRRSGDRSEAK